MKSSTGKYFIGLDHIRAVAMFMVFSWHFIHVYVGYRAYPPVLPLSLLSEGHTGVALFMTLSGYLFSKLLDGKDIHYVAFLYNRFLRLAPLLILVIILVGFQRYFSGRNLFIYVKHVLSGVVMPSLPNGGWSITVECHFYLILPLLLLLVRKWKYSLFILVLSTVIIRALIHHHNDQIQLLSYWTIVGRIDQFLFGMIVYQFRNIVSGRHFFVTISTVLFAMFYWYFNLHGGFYKNPSYPSPSSVWIYMPTIEGFAYAVIIAWYDNSFAHSTGRFSRFVALIGTCSYSIYLLHFFIVFRLPIVINNYVADLSNIYLAIFFSGICFLMMVPIGYISYRFIETPFLKFRTQYIFSKE